jgi:K+-sensing histidine kinase KdpD
VQAMIVRKIIHEVRDPLNGILGYSEMLASGYYGEMGALQHGIVSDVINCGKKISGFIKECNSFLLNKAGKLRFEWRRMSIKDLIESLVKNDQSRFDNNKSKVIIRSKDKGMVVADKEKLAIAFSSIIEYVCIKSKPQNDINIVMEETRSCVHVMFIFWPSDNFNSKVDTLSISLCKMIVEMHKGELALKIVDNGFAHLRIMVPKKKSI